MKGGIDLQPGEVDLHEEGGESLVDSEGYSIPGSRKDGVVTPNPLSKEGYSGPQHQSELESPPSWLHSEAPSPTTGPLLRVKMSPTIPERNKQIDESARNLREKLIHLFKYKNETGDTLDGENLKLIEKYVTGWVDENKQREIGRLTGHDDLIKRVIEENNIVIKVDSRPSSRWQRDYEEALKSILEGKHLFF